MFKILLLCLSCLTTISRAELTEVKALKAPTGQIVIFYGDDHKHTPKDPQQLESTLTYISNLPKEKAEGMHILVEGTLSVFKIKRDPFILGFLLDKIQENGFKTPAENIEIRSKSICALSLFLNRGFFKATLPRYGDIRTAFIDCCCNIQTLTFGDALNELDTLKANALQFQHQHPNPELLAPTLKIIEEKLQPLKSIVASNEIIHPRAEKLYPTGVETNSDGQKVLILPEGYKEIVDGLRWPGIHLFDINAYKRILELQKPSDTQKKPADQIIIFVGLGHVEPIMKLLKETGYSEILLQNDPMQLISATQIDANIKP